MQDYSINYVNCSPSENSERFIRDLMEHLCEEAPSESNLKSNLKLTITKVTDSGYSGVLNLNCQRISFSAIASARSPSLLAQQLLDRIRRQLDSWKSSRFRNSMRRMKHLKPNRQRSSLLSS